MKRITTLLVLVLVMMCSPGAVGTAQAFSWQLHDFGDNQFDHNNNWSPISYPYGIGNLPSPGLLGEGGEFCDLEGFHYKKTGSTVNVALVNSFGLSAYSSGWDRNYALGDIFFGFDGNQYEYVLDVDDGYVYQLDSRSDYIGIQTTPGTYGGTDIGDQAGAWQRTGGTRLGGVGVTSRLSHWDELETNPLQGDGDTWVLEFQFETDQIAGFEDFETISFHNTLECGNDLVEETYSAVPEPATVILLGFGLASAGYLRRRRK